MRSCVLTLAYGPATAAVLGLLWLMVLATVLGRGLQLPHFDFGALQPQVLFGVTLPGFTRLLAILTGVEIFATLEPAFEGIEAKRSRRPSVACCSSSSPARRYCWLSARPPSR